MRASICVCSWLCLASCTGKHTDVKGICHSAHTLLFHLAVTLEARSPWQQKMSVLGMGGVLGRGLNDGGD